jgi:HPt (histidine-containing phosphotransfer) domain-containing protein
MGVINLSSDCWDRSRALDSVGGDEEFLSELAGIFSAACPTLLKSLDEAIARKNLFSAADTAHLLGRAAKNLAAARVAEAALAIELMARRNELEDIGNACYGLRQEATQLLTELADFRDGRQGLPNG